MQHFIVVKCMFSVFPKYIIEDYTILSYVKVASIKTVLSGAISSIKIGGAISSN